MLSPRRGLGDLRGLGLLFRVSAWIDCALANRPESVSGDAQTRGHLGIGESFITQPQDHLFALPPHAAGVRVHLAAHRSHNLTQRPSADPFASMLSSEGLVQRWKQDGHP